MPHIDETSLRDGNALGKDVHPVLRLLSVQPLHPGDRCLLRLDRIHQTLQDILK